jgi:predicted TIM-barrel fold metal-dependent hydrolase
MFGSAWPVNEADGGFLRWFRLPEALAAPWSVVNQQNFFHQNAAQLYRLPDRP